MERDGDRKFKMPATYFDTSSDLKQPVSLEAVMELDKENRRLEGGVSFRNHDRKSTGHEGSFASLSSRELTVIDDAIVLSPNSNGRIALHGCS